MLARIEELELRHWLLVAVPLVFMVVLNGAIGRPLPGLSPATSARHLYLKLPLEQPRFHWRFESSAEFLSGKLTLRMIRDDSVTELIIFDDGVISEGWQTIGEDRGGTIYFGFRSTDTYVTAPSDSLEIELEVLQDLEGEGQLYTGILPAGSYSSAGSYSGLNNRPWMKNEDYVPWAFMQCWRELWPLVITSNDGWLGAEAAAQVRAPRKRIGAIASWFGIGRRDGTDGESCLEPGGAR